MSEDTHVSRVLGVIKSIQQRLADEQWMLLNCGHAYTLSIDKLRCEDERKLALPCSHCVSVQVEMARINDTLFGHHTITVLINGTKHIQHFGSWVCKQCGRTNYALYDNTDRTITVTREVVG